jgi:hypothetical protein
VTDLVDRADELEEVIDRHGRRQEHVEIVTSLLDTQRGAYAR